MLNVFTATFLVSLCRTSGHGQWEYEGQNGPGWWHFNFPLCGGFRQSPVSIQTNEAVMNSDWLAPIQMRGYESLENLQMYVVNTGYTVQINLQGANVSITGGGLTDVYIAQQFHFHWGKTNQRGSEHNIDGKYFPMEMHIVHYNTRYNNFVDALDKEGGLAVLAFLFEIGEHNTHFDQILNHIPKPAEYIQMQTFDMHDLLPENLDGYCRYYGSLTTPPCHESAIWFIFYETIEISRRQLNTFRHSVHLNVGNEEIRHLMNHFRPLQPLNGRKIYCRNKEW